MAESESPTTTPYVEDLIVIRRRVRVGSNGTEMQVVVCATSKDSDLLLATLERGKWAVGHQYFLYEPELTVPGFPEVDEGGG